MSLPDRSKREILESYRILEGQNALQAQRIFTLEAQLAAAQNVSAIVERAIAEDAHKHPEDLAAVLAAVTRERDEARNEAKRWSGHNRHSKEVIVRQSRRIEALTRQRDEARAELGGSVCRSPKCERAFAALSPERTAELMAGQAEGEPK